MRRAVSLSASGGAGRRWPDPVPRTPNRPSRTGTPLVRPASSSPVPSATTIASGARSRRVDAFFASDGSGPIRRTAGNAIADDTTMSGSRPRKTHRQPTASPTMPAMAGPSTPGRTQAVERVANICGRRCSGRLRPIATYAIGGTVPAPRPWRNRAPTRISIVGARPPMIRPIAKSPMPAANGPPSPRRSMSPPTSTIPISEPSMKAVNTQPYSSRPFSSSATIGMIVETASASKATRVIVRTSPTVRPRRPGDHSPPPPRVAVCGRSGPGTSSAAWLSVMVQVCPGSPWRASAVRPMGTRHLSRDGRLARPFVAGTSGCSTAASEASLKDQLIVERDAVLTDRWDRWLERRPASASTAPVCSSTRRKPRR